ncbi:MAG: glutamine--fructose-6-phosphate transaminase (isomerizing), partial [Gammaproteobacteria bacterium]|nr:glutamine--fructose-6-phosphate transaminase (isomerizing) [Gammaproteobacteria bacterium]
MCGIVGAVAHRPVQSILLTGLRRLEYRGYDSAGLALLTGAGLQRARTAGKVAALAAELQAAPLDGHCGIAHTRWATHGRPNRANAHPHMSGERLAVVHNGIIENHEALRQTLQQQGVVFSSETDSEVVVHLVAGVMDAGHPLLAAVQQVVQQLEGAYALALISPELPDALVAARRGSPLVIGVGDGENYLASDIFALLDETRQYIVLEDGDVAMVTPERIEIFDETGAPVERPLQQSGLTAAETGKGEYRHYMLKEIYEQPRAIAHTLAGRLQEDGVPDAAFGTGAARIFDQVESVQIVACGTSYHAGAVARYWLEGLAGLPCWVEVASEFRYRTHVVPENCLLVVISQSGETADTLAALREGQRIGYAHSLAICNVPESSLTRVADLVLLTHAGPEVGVASTKAFTTQLVALLLLTLALGRRHRITPALGQALLAQLRGLPQRVERVLAMDAVIAGLAEQFVHRHHALFLGRGAHYPVALEGALKLKEIS